MRQLEWRQLGGAVAWNRFGSHRWILQISGTKEPSGFSPITAEELNVTTKAVPSNGAPKAPPIYAQPSDNRPSTSSLQQVIFPKLKVHYYLFQFGFSF